MPAEHLMTDAALDAFIDASAAVLGLTIAPEWRAAVRANLTVTFRLGAVVEEFELPDEAEPAAVFTA
jgi:1-carboxybiuret hydrolase subunit AtzG-like protein